MRITIFGAGALGSLVGGLLSVQHDVTLICREPYARVIDESGLKVSGIMERAFHPRTKTQVEGLKEQDIVFITVKAYDTKESLSSVEPIVGDHTMVVSMQNGLNNVDLITSRYGLRSMVVLTSLGATLIGPGSVMFAGSGDSVIGSREAGLDMMTTVQRALYKAGMPSRVVEDLDPELWMKAIVNACINPITALTRDANGCIADSPHLSFLAKEVCMEASAAASSNGIRLPVADPFTKVMEVVRRTSANRSSMLQDLDAGRKTEIDEITGEIVLRGERKGLNMPRNRVLWALVQEISHPCSRRC